MLGSPLPRIDADERGSGTLPNRQKLKSKLRKGTAEARRKAKPLKRGGTEEAEDVGEKAKPTTD